MNTLISDIAFTAAVKALQIKQGSCAADKKWKQKGAGGPMLLNSLPLS